MLLFNRLFKIISFVFVLSSLVFSQTEKQITDIITSAKTRFVPDKRLGVFKVEFKLEGNNISFTGESDNKEAVEFLTAELQKIENIKIENKINMLPDQKLGDKNFGVISVSTANMRYEPDYAAELISQAILGTEVKLLKRRSGYFLVQTPEKYLGWIETGSIVTGNLDFIEDWRKCKKIIFTDIFGLIYADPNDESYPVGDIVIGSTVRYDSTMQEWIKVKLPRGESGYLKRKASMDYDKWIKTRNATPENIIETARKFTGFPYLWGGYSSKGLDCSGFAKTVFWLNGILLPRDANQQAFAGEEIKPGQNYENVKTGDLLFFGSKDKDGKPKITHVGIYMGDKNFIHCSVNVHVSSLNKDSNLFDPLHSDRLVKIVRILK